MRNDDNATNIRQILNGRLDARRKSLGGFASTGAEMIWVSHHTVHGISGCPVNSIPRLALPRAKITFTPVRVGSAGYAKVARKGFGNRAGPLQIAVDYHVRSERRQMFDQGRNHFLSLARKARITLTIAAFLPCF